MVGAVPARLIEITGSGPVWLGRLPGGQEY